MKKTLLALVALATAVAASAQPILVGHRGSGYGLESSEEAFLKGIELGYQYLESDVKVTKDLQFVLSHDDDTKRLGGTKTIATSTLEELQSETLSQTRSGVKYTGKICSLNEWLDICKQHNVRPLIELKWATGVNSNDCHNIPLLIKTLEDKGFRDKCIILTSMKPCLEYIRTNYPDIELQFLTGQYWENHFDWCVEHGIDVDIQAGYFDKNTVKRYHQNGLKVNMWTTNDDAGYLNYGNMGCDFITTDRLDTSKLPELDPSVTFPANTTDYPETDQQLTWVRGNYTWGEPRETLLANAPAAKLDNAVFNSPTSGTAVADDGSIYCWEGSEIIRQYPSQTFPGAIALGTADGHALALAGKTLLIPGLENCSVDIPEGVTSATFSGTLRNGILYTVSGNTLTATTGNFTIGQISHTASTLPITPCAIRISHSNTANILAAAADSENILDLTHRPGQEAATYATYALPGLSTAHASHSTVLRHGEKVYLLTLNQDNTLSITDITAPGATPYSVSEPLEHQSAVCGSRAWSVDGNAWLQTISNDWKITELVFAQPRTIAEPTDLGLKLERQWILSNTTGNHPGNIDGTNAQQGTAVDGRFYINDCADQKIYVFDPSGLLGTLPGGKGWGCCRDDAGNIIVRDDKLTGNSHSFLIYPAKPDLANPPRALAIDVTVPLEGQTNFISASGDILGSTGYIYLYPNKQTAVNIIPMVKGAVGTSGARASQTITLTGTTAGLVVPQDNDPENWLYQIRGTGFYAYSGGGSEAFHITRASTTAPARNSTGGGAVIQQGGNTVFIHNSGANYKGGFTVRDMSTDKVIANVDPIGTLGYETGGNYSTFNWLTVEKTADSDYRIYQYCPANGIAEYRLYNPSSGVDKIADAAQDMATITFDGTTATSDIPGITAYSISGIAVAHTSGTTLDMSSLACGIYILRQSNGFSVRVCK